MRHVRLGGWFTSFVQQYLPSLKIGDKMKTFKAIGAAFVLALSLSIPAYADTAPGDGHTPGRSVPNPGAIGTPTTEPENAGLTCGAPADEGDTSFLNIADILWALASIY